jgi:2-oxo-4-hydroxy-4-carboxy--5-ureidoimidazoline (OHCU) decarboxylase
MISQLFENAGPLIERLERLGPFATTDALLARARDVLATLTEAEKIAVINAHPRIGERPERVRAQSAISYREQGYEGDTTPPEVMAELARLNAQYERRFGFRFVVFVNRRAKAALLPVLRERLARSRTDELATALAEFLAIAADRGRAR